jgi:nicotinamide-nucleotide amidase
MPIEQEITLEFRSQKKKLALAESCTGGAIAARLVKVPGASLFFLGGIVAYSNAWKERFLGVRKETLSKQGAVSAAVVEEMVQGLFERSEADYAVAVSGTLGPTGGTPQKPVGTLFVAIGKRGDKTDIHRMQAPPERIAGIEFAVVAALKALLARMRT